MLMAPIVAGRITRRRRQRSRHRRPRVMAMALATGHTRVRIAMAMERTSRIAIQDTDTHGHGPVDTLTNRGGRNKAEKYQHSGFVDIAIAPKAGGQGAIVRDISSLRSAG